MNGGRPLTGTIRATQSPSWILRESFLLALQRLPYFALFTVRRNPHPGPIQPKDLPMFGVYILADDLTPDTSDVMGNAGAISFIDNVRIGFSVMILNNDPALAEREVDEAYRAICNGLWKNQYITNFFTSWNPGAQQYEMYDDMHFEAVTRGQRRHKFGNLANTNQTPYAELQYDIIVRYREYFDPVITDDLLRIHGEAFPGQYKRDENHEVAHVEYQWEFPRP